MMSPLTPRQDEAGLPPSLQREPYLKPVERVTDQLEIPSLDDRQYRVIRLPNDLESLLVHDPETDKASAALDVNVGNFSDEDDMPGMAHAVEHVSPFPGQILPDLPVELTDCCLASVHGHQEISRRERLQRLSFVSLGQL